MAGLLGFAVAGGLQGAGEGLVKVANQRREDALMALAERNKDRREARRKGGLAPDTKPDRGADWQPSNSELVRMEKIYASAFGGRFQSGGPELGDFQSEAIRLMRADKTLSVIDAANMASKAWVEKEDVEKERGKWSPARLIGDDTYTKSETVNEFRYPGQDMPESTIATDENPNYQLARDAIAQGADANAVKARLRSMGLDPEKL